MAGKNTKKKKRKNSNYRTVVKYINIDQMCRKSLCDYRNMPETDPAAGRSPEVDQNKYEKAVHFCTVAQIITPEEKEAFSKLVQKGVKLYIQNTPRDVKRDVTELLK